MKNHQKNHFWNIALFTRFNLGMRIIPFVDTPSSCVKIWWAGRAAAKSSTNLWENQICRVQCWHIKMCFFNTNANLGPVESILNMFLALFNLLNYFAMSRFSIEINYSSSTAMLHPKTWLGQGWGLSRPSMMVPVMVLQSNHTLSYSSPGRLCPQIPN